MVLAPIDQKADPDPQVETCQHGFALKIADHPFPVAAMIEGPGQLAAIEFAPRGPGGTEEILNVMSDRQHLCVPNRGSQRPAHQAQAAHLFVEGEREDRHASLIHVDNVDSVIFHVAHDIDTAEIQPDFAAELCDQLLFFRGKDLISGADIGVQLAGTTPRLEGFKLVEHGRNGALNDCGSEIFAAHPIIRAIDEALIDRAVFNVLGWDRAIHDLAIMCAIQV